MFGETYLLLCCIQVQTWAQSLVYTLEELECKICYNRYDTRSRKPKLLGCLHRVCAKCLKKMVDMGEFTWEVDTQHSQLLDHADASMTVTWSHHLLYHVIPGESSPSIISCPFCRHETYVPDEEVWPHFLLFDGQSLTT